MAMNPGMKMMLMQRNVERGKESEYGGTSGRRMIGYDRDQTENRRQRDGRGRFMEGGGWQGNAYNEGSYNGGNEYARMGGYGMEPRQQRGRYMMDDDEDETRGYRPRMMDGSQMRSGNSYGDIYAKGTIYAPGAMNKPGGAHHHEGMYKPVDEQQARKWVRKMDGGEKFKAEHAEQMRNNLCPECDKWEFYVALNMMYSDYCDVAKKMNVDRPEFYGCMAKAFLCDEDAGEHKLQKYMENIPE